MESNLQGGGLAGNENLFVLNILSFPLIICVDKRDRGYEEWLSYQDMAVLLNTIAMKVSKCTKI